MTQDAFEVRTSEKIKVGDVGVYNGELVVVVKHGKHSGVISIADIIRQIFGEGIRVSIWIFGNLEKRMKRIEQYEKTKNE